MIDDLENIQGIYIITQISTGKKYVGKSRRVRYRVKSHCKKGKKSLIQKTISNFGIDDFTVEARYFPEVSPDELVEIEYEAILNEGSLFPNGFNRACRGYNNVTDRSHIIGRKRTELTKQRMRGKRVWSEQGRLNIRKARHERCPRHTFVNMKTHDVFVGIIPDFIRLHGFSNSAKTALSTRKRHSGWNIL